jgi:integrase
MAVSDKSKAVRLTVRILEKLKPGEEARDSEVSGLIADVGPTGIHFRFRKVMRLGSRGDSPRSQTAVHMTLGTYPHVTLEQARQTAAVYAAQVRRGIDPRKGDAQPAPPVAEEEWTVDKLMDEYIADREQAEKAARTIQDIRNRYRAYLDVDIEYVVKDPKTQRKSVKAQKAWGPLRLSEVTAEMARERHRGIHLSRATGGGKVVANDTMRNFRAAFNWARETKRIKLLDNPAETITFYPQRPRTEELTLPDVAGWGQRVERLRNPIRRELLRLAAYSGMRPGSLMPMERSWVSFDERVIRVPADKMKKRRAFHLPLSQAMIDIIKRALAVGDVLYPGSPYLFPTRSNKDRQGSVIPTASMHNKSLESETGYVLRHLFSNVAASVDVGKAHRMMLMGQKVAGLEGTYLNDRFLFDSLLVAQERISGRISALLSAAPSPKYLAEMDAADTARRAKDSEKRAMKRARQHDSSPADLMKSV